MEVITNLCFAFATGLYKKNMVYVESAPYVYAVIEDH
jgi:hypothetical protein